MMAAGRNCIRGTRVQSAGDKRPRRQLRKPGLRAHVGHREFVHGADTLAPIPPRIAGGEPFTDDVCLVACELRS